MKQYFYLKDPKTGNVVEESFPSPIGISGFQSIEVTLRKKNRATWTVVKAFTSEEGSQEVLNARDVFKIV